MKRVFGLMAIAMVTSINVNAKEADKEACMKILGAGIYNGLLEDMCGFNGMVKEKLKAIYADNGCPSLINYEEINQLVLEVLDDTMDRKSAMGEEDFCNGNKEPYYALAEVQYNPINR